MKKYRSLHLIGLTCHWVLPVLFALLGIAPAFTQKLQQKTEPIPAGTPVTYTWWNLLHYRIDLFADYSTKTISGTNEIEFSALQTGRELRIDLQEPMAVERISWRNSPLPFKKTSSSSYIISFPESIVKGSIETIAVAFKGKPQEAVRPPYGSGWIWEKDEKGRPWISVACEGAGASIWLPCKEVLYDEPDRGATVSITVPDTMAAVANGRLQGQERHPDGTSTYTWVVTSPINNYNIIPYIGKYVTWHNEYAGIKGKLDCDYWVLDYNLTKAKQHFKQADTMLAAFEYWLGPYPFYEDSYKLVESPMPGMEHQSAVAYGNGFQNGFLGKDFISNTGWGLKWDFMLVHESGHEWFGNSITAVEGGESWIHEGFTKYLETLYTDYVFGTQAGKAYALGTWKRIKNDEVIIGNDTSDKYYKGSAMLHMIRQLLGDVAFRGWLQKLHAAFYHQTVSTKQILRLLNNYSGKDFTPVFNQYLRTTNVPELAYYFQRNAFYYRWSNCVDGFDMPLKVSFDKKSYALIYPTSSWRKMSMDGRGYQAILVDSNFYVKSRVLAIKK